MLGGQMEAGTSETYDIMFDGEITRDQRGKDCISPYEYQITICDKEGNKITCTDKMLRRWLGYIEKKQSGQYIQYYTKHEENR